MTFNIDTVSLGGATSDGTADLDIGLGAPAGQRGTDGFSIKAITQPSPGVIGITLSDDSSLQFTLPPGPAGSAGVNGLTPVFIGGTVTLIPFGSTPGIVVRSTTTPNLYAIDLAMPDPTVSAIQANIAAGQAELYQIQSTISAEESAASAALSQAQVALAAAQIPLAAAQVDLAAEQVGFAVDQVGLATAQATNAATSAGEALSFAAAAAASYDAFDDRWLGDKAALPTADNDSNPLVPGAIVFLTTGDEPGFRRWDGAVWQKAFFVISGAVQSFNGRAGDVVPEPDDYAVADIAGLPEALTEASRTVTAASLWFAGG